MGKTYRIPARVGVDQNLTLQVDQDFEQLEILSLKIRQEDVYTRACSDYGVLTGRVFVNNGYGIPNAKVSIFIPIEQEDEQNPVIEAIYPYKSLTQVNEDGYKYNLLPYLPSYNGHVPTGTFPSRLDALIDNTVIEVYNKYYKFTVTTNDSGDYMIFGVPVGTQTMVMNVDLSDIGEFSLSPDDLIRMGLAVESQFDGNKFKSSVNFTELPQIIVLNKTVNIAPFWGEPDVCQISITRTDFDLTSEANIEIMPTSVFMGSLISTTDDDALKTSCIPENTLGELCSLVAGPGEILALRQTVFLDDAGQPILEQSDLPNGGRVIDENGTWLLDLPMNLDYIYTNEFGQKVISNDPTIGVPTKGKYRFKIKWQQSDTLSEAVRRAYFLVPNIREYGWDYNNPDNDPLINPLNPTDTEIALKSYAFSLDWSAYTDYNVAVNCEDYFYQFDYNKVYTVAQMIDNVKTEKHREKFLGIKTIDDRTCEEGVNKFPVNDGVFHATSNWRMINFLLTVVNFFIPIIMVILHILIGLFELLIALLFVLAAIYITLSVLSFIQAGSAFAPAPGANIPLGVSLIAQGVTYIIQALVFAGMGIGLIIAGKPPHPIPLPMLTYPSCEACECEDIPDPDPNSSTVNLPPNYSTNSAPSTLIPFNSVSSYQEFINEDFFNQYFNNTQCNLDYNNPDLGGYAITTLLAGEPYNQNSPSASVFVPTNSSIFPVLWTDSLPLGERINLFNTKGKFFGGTGVNRIKVSWDYAAGLSGVYHFDNTLTFLALSQTFDFNAGDMLTFVDNKLSTDPNLTGGTGNIFGTNSITGTTTYPTTAVTFQLSYANTEISNTTVDYTGKLSTPQTLGDELIYDYKSDIEYFQVITALTLSDFFALADLGGSYDTNTFADILSGKTYIYTDLCGPTPYVELQPISANTSYLTDYKVCILQRGVDPYSPKYKINFDLSRIFGQPIGSNPAYTIIDNVGIYKLNVPIKAGSGTGICVEHNNITFNNSTNNGSFLFFDSYHFTPSNSDYLPYVSNLHLFYSSLDSAHNSFSPELSPTANLLSVFTQGGTNNSRNTSVNNLFNGHPFLPLPDSRNYYPTNTNLDGGSYMFADVANPGSNRFYFSPTYLITDTTDTIQMNNNSRIVMRSDRLPTSSSTGGSLNNQFLLQQNINFIMFDESGNPTSAPSTNVTIPPIGGVGGFTVSSANTVFNNVLNTFDCAGMVQLPCYTASGVNFGVKENCGNDDAVSGGCYVFIKRPLVDLGKDIDNAVEWGYRLRFFYALCSGVLSHVFNNNWINGTLYAYSYRLDTEFDDQNQPISLYCNQTIVFDQQTNNLYYRSSPYATGATQPFIGRPVDTVANETNVRNLMYPTTIVNYGPKNQFLEQIVLNGNYDGYNMNKLPFTSYAPTGDLVNFFSVVRIAGNVDWANGVSENLITNLFSRPQERVDADFAQMASINSELGIIKFDADFYSTGGVNPGAVLLPGMTGSSSSSFDNMMGVFYEQNIPQDIQTRDYVSPMRSIYQNIITSAFTYSPITVYSQLVPFYRWKVESASPQNIFGTALNNWATGNGLNSLPNDIIVRRYQQLDRISDPYFQAPNINDDYGYRGYIYALTSSGDYQYSGFSTVNPILVGAPNHHYYGLRRGRTAMNRFYTKYIGENT